MTTSSGTAEGSLPYAVALANAGHVSIIDFDPAVGLIALNTQLFLNANLTINGFGGAIDMGQRDRAFFIAGGTVTINNLSISAGLARGGDGADGGGGGAGLGGAIFIGNGTYDTANSAGPAIAISIPNVTLANVSFIDNMARGGNGAPSDESSAGGGGGGMGGDGGAGYSARNIDLALTRGGGGGGGFGVGADGGASNPDTPQAGGVGSFIFPANPNWSGGGGSADNSGGLGGSGGAMGGGGGGANASSEAPSSPGGGGGVGGTPAFLGINGPSYGGSGGFGGGGGGAAIGGFVSSGGAGGFGGGGGGGGSEPGGNGGFGGGGGGGGNAPAHSGGFGAGNGSSGAGGGGLGAGGAIFVREGATLHIVDSVFSVSSVQSGTAGDSSAQSGSAIGADLFLGADLDVTVTGTNTMTLSDLGGNGDSSDSNVSAHPGDEASGGLTKLGNGRLVLAGNNSYTGSTFINEGTLVLSGRSSSREHVVFSSGTFIVQGSDSTLEQVQVNDGGIMLVDVSAQDLRGNVSVNAGGVLVLNGGGNGSVPFGIDVMGRMEGAGYATEINIHEGAVLAPSPSSAAGTLAAEFLGWGDGGTIEISLGQSLMEVGTLAKNSPGIFNFHFLSIDGVQVGGIYDLIGYRSTQFNLTDFTFTSPFDGLNGSFISSWNGIEGADGIAFQVTSVPEPSVWTLLGFALLLLAILRRAVTFS